MATVNTISTLDGNFKVVYDKKIVNLLPDFAIISKKVPFKPSERIGEQYVVPVKLQHEHGFTYGASGDGAFDLNSSVAGKIGKAVVNSAQIVLRSQLDYEAAFKAVAGGQQAFVSSTQAMVENMTESFAKRQELAFLYGSSSGGLGLISSNTIADGNTSVTLTLTDKSWAAGIWVGMKNCPIDVYQANLAAKINSSTVSISSVDISNKKLTVTTSSGDLSGLEANAVIFFKGAKGKECNGIDKILTNTGSLYSINAALYEVWQSSSYDVAGSLSMTKVMEAATQAVALGLKEDVMLLCSPSAWTDLNNDLAALQRYDSSYRSSQFKSGAEGIEYYGVSGKIEIIAHPFVKDGEAFLLPIRKCKRVGATDMTFRRPGNPNSFFRELESSAGFELRAYSDQQMFIEAPGMAVKLTGIT